MSLAEVWLPPPPPSALEIDEMACTTKRALGLERKYMAHAQVVKESDDIGQRKPRLDYKLTSRIGKSFIKLMGFGELGIVRES